MLLEAGANPNVKNEEGFSVLDTIMGTFKPDDAFKDENQEGTKQWILMLNLLKEKGINFKDPDRPAIPVFLVSVNQSWAPKASLQLAVIKYLMAEGADIKARVGIDNNPTILMVLIQLNDTDQDLFQGLIDLGADVLSKDDKGRNLSDYIPNLPPSKNRDVAEWLRQLYYDKCLEEL